LAQVEGAAPVSLIFQRIDFRRSSGCPVHMQPLVRPERQKDSFLFPRRRCTVVFE
jgi:hypothetical protein